MKKRTKELAILISLIVLVTITVLSIVPNPNSEVPETFTGLFVEYQGKMIGGDIQGNLIVLTNGTTMGLDEFKRITGYKP